MTSYAFELVAAGLRSDDPFLAVLEQDERSWLKPDHEAAYVDVRKACVQPDGRVCVTALVTRFAGAEPLGMDVPQVHQPTMPVGTTSYRNSRPLHAYIRNAVLWKWSVALGVGHPARSQVVAEGYLAAAQTEFPDDATRRKSLRSALLDIAAQSPLPAEVPQEKVFHGASYDATVKAITPDKYEVHVFAQEQPHRGSMRVVDGKISNNAPQYYVSADELEAWLSGWVNRLAVPDVGEFSAITTNGQATVLSFRRPSEEH